MKKFLEHHFKIKQRTIFRQGFLMKDVILQWKSGIYSMQHSNADKKHCIDWTQDHNSKMTSSLQEPVTTYRSLFSFKMVLEEIFSFLNMIMQVEWTSVSPTFMIFAYT